MNRFPVLRLPYLVLKEVIESIEKTDVLNLAMASKKTYRLIETTKNAVSMKKLRQEEINKLGVIDRLKVAHLETIQSSGNIRKELEVEVSKQLFLTMRTYYFGDNVSKLMRLQVRIDSIENRNEENQTMRFGVSNVPVIIASNDTVHTKFDDVKVGLQFLCHHFIQTFDLKKPFSLRIIPEQADYPLFSGMLRLVIDFVKRTSKEHDIIFRDFGSLTNQDSQYVLNDAKYGNIIIYGRPTGERNPGSFVCEGRSLTLHNADWFTLEDLMLTKCGYLFLHKSGMTNDLMKKIMMIWIDGKLDKLSSLSVELQEDVDTEVILSGLSNRTGHVITHTENRIRIDRKDGRRATIVFSNDENEKKVFKMTSI